MPLIAIEPIFFSLGPINIYWFSICYLVGFIVICLGIYYRSCAESAVTAPKELNFSPDNKVLYDLFFYGFVGSFIGARVGYTIFNHLDYLQAEPLWLIKIWYGGMSFHGGIIGFIGASYLVAIKHKQRLLTVLDTVAPFAPIALLCGHFYSCFGHNILGTPSHVEWAIIYPLSLEDIPRHPVQLYGLIFEGALLLFCLQILARKPQKLGLLSGLFLIGYGVLNFIIAFFIEHQSDDVMVLSYFSIEQLLSFSMTIAGIYIIYWGYVNHEHALILGNK